MMGPHKNLDAWQKSIQLVDEIYRVTRSFPQDELFCLVTQMRRAAISIPSNIAEGYGRSSNSEVIRFLYNSLGSSNELDTQIILSRRQSLINDVDFAIVEGLNDEVHKMLQSLIYVGFHPTFSALGRASKLPLLSLNENVRKRQQI